MRKLLLATAVAMGASLAGVGTSHAQMQTLTPGLTAGWGGLNGPTLGGLPTIQPGSVVVRLGGRFEFYAADFMESGDRETFPTTATNGFAGQTNKTSQYGFYSYARLYPTVDGVLSNGLQYGAFVEIRTDNYAGAGGQGVNDNGNSAGTSVSASDRSRGQLYLRRSYGYFGAPAFGTVRFGSGDGPSSLFETGTFENFNDGAWNGDVPNILGNASIAPLFATVGAMYTTNKVVYLSPNFYGFDFGLGYEPNTGNVTDTNGGNPQQLVTIGGVTSLTGTTSCFVATAGCDNLAASSVSSAVAARRNTVDISSRYRATFGPVGVAVQLGWIGSQHVKADASATGVAPATRYEGFNIGDFGATATFAGVSVGGHITGGHVNGQWGLAPVGAEPSIWAIGGASYAIGPLVAGASYFEYDSPGSSGPGVAGVGQLRERGFAAGATYSLGTGVAMFVNYLNGNRKENGVNLWGDGGAGTRQTNANVLAVGTFIRW